MMQLTDKYHPRCLADIVGQPTHKLRWLVDAPFRSCWLLEGAAGIGKSAAAHAVANELGCTVFSKHTYKAGLLTKDTIADLFGHTTRCVPMDGAPMHVVVIEEFERCVSADARSDLKAALDADVAPCHGGLPSRCVVVATSNDPSKIEPALVERFRLLHFESGPEFALACQERLAWIWGQECPDMDMPQGWLLWGWQGNLERFSMRVAIREMEEYVGILQSLQVNDAVPCGAACPV
jgi:hypothetical protein